MELKSLILGGVASLSFLLIVPYGIEIYEFYVGKTKKRLLIVPYGIEI